jgi:hypothetical protein
MEDFEKKTARLVQQIASLAQAYPPKDFHQQWMKAFANKLPRDVRGVCAEADAIFKPHGL